MRYATTIAFCLVGKRFFASTRRILRHFSMNSQDGGPPPPDAAATASSHSYTTNEEDQREAARLQQRLRANLTTGKVTKRVDPVQIAKGRHKYVLIQAENDGETEYFVTSRKGAHYHRNAAEPLIYELEAAGYSDINVTGGGRIDFDEVNKTIR
jgi:hypothetical protein